MEETRSWKSFVIEAKHNSRHGVYVEWVRNKIILGRLFKQNSSD